MPHHFYFLQSPLGQSEAVFEDTFFKNFTYATISAYSLYATELFLRKDRDFCTICSATPSLIGPISLPPPLQQRACLMIWKAFALLVPRLASSSPLVSSHNLIYRHTHSHRHKFAPKDTTLELHFAGNLLPTQQALLLPYYSLFCVHLLLYQAIAFTLSPLHWIGCYIQTTNNITCIDRVTQFRTTRQAVDFD